MDTVNIKTKPEDECLELKNINYKTMLLTGVQQPVQRKQNISENIANIDLFCAMRILDHLRAKQCNISNE